MRSVATALISAMLMPVALRAEAAAIFKHVIIIFQENRTPDNLFGSNPTFEPGVDIATSDLNSKGQSVTFGAEALDGCYDLGHSHIAFESMLNQGPDKVGVTPNSESCVVPANPQFKYADNSTGMMQPYFDIASNYGFANRMFQSNQGASFASHQFIFGGTSSPSTDSPLFVSDNMLNRQEVAGCIAPPDQRTQLIDGYGSLTSNAPIYPCFERPTLGDLLDRAALSWKYYTPQAGSIWTAPDAINHICRAAMVDGTLACTGPDWTNGSVVLSSSQVLTDIQNCQLAAVSWVIPTALESDHASLNNGTGPQWVASVVDQLGNQPTCARSGENYWNDTAIFISWDDWGGWADHVKPPLVRLQPQSAPAWGDGYTFGFRVPLMVVSAYTPAHYVDNGIHDFGSILYFIEKNFRLGFIGPGNTMYSNYDDWQEANEGDDMHQFFSLTSPKPFVSIKTDVPARYFQTRPPSSVPIDNE